MNRPTHSVTVPLDSEDHPHRKLRYSLLCAEERDEAGNGHAAYGIEIRLLDPQREPEIRAITDISFSEEAAIRLLRLLSESTVTPVIFPEIVDDILGVPGGILET